MRIGILTYHKSHNYGALLQAVALRYYLINCGYEVYFIDYWPKYHGDMYKRFDYYLINDLRVVSKIKYLIKRFLNIRNINKRINSFNGFIAKYITPYCLPESEYFDYVVYGSDQIWRRQERLNSKYNPVYFGEHSIKTKNHVSYAASMGIIDANDSDKIQIKKWLNKFKGISVRETSLKEFLTKAGINNIELVIDPTLLLDSEKWKKLLNVSKSEEKYVLFYDLMEGSFNIDNIRRFAQERGLKLITLKARIDKFHMDNNERAFEDPAGMLALFANAEFIFTSSYHGLVFSLIFHKEFYASFKENAERAHSLLNYLELSGRLIKKGEELKGCIPLDYLSIDNKISFLRRRSIKFIDDIITPLNY